MYTLDFIGLFKEGFSWLFDSKGGLNKSMIILVLKFSVILALLESLPILGKYLNYPSFGTNGSLALIVISLVFIVARIMFSFYLVFSFFSYSFKNSGMSFARKRDIGSIVHYFIFTIVSYFYTLLALPSKLKFIAIPILVLEVLGVLLLVLALITSLSSASSGVSSSIFQGSGLGDLREQLPSLLTTFLAVACLLFLVVLAQFIIVSFMGLRTMVSIVEYFSGAGILESLDRTFALTRGKAIKIFLTSSGVGLILLLLMIPVVFVLFVLGFAVNVTDIVATYIPVIGPIIGFAASLVYSFVALVFGIAYTAFYAYYLVGLSRNIKNYSRFE